MSRARRATACLVAAAMTAMLVPAVPAAAATSSGTEYEDQGLKYVVDADGTAGVEGVIDTSVTSISVPEELGGHTVTRVSPRAFWSCNYLEHISLPKTLKYVSLDSAGKQTAGLWDIDTVQDIEIDPACPSFCTVDGVLYSADKTELVSYPGGKPVTSFSIPEGTKTVRVSGLQAARSLVELHLPSTLSNANGNLVSACESLEAVTVSNKNAYYSANDGVLFNKSGTKLIAYPRAKGASSYSIPKGVTALEDNALTDQSVITAVTIPQSLQTVGKLNFTWCRELVSISVDTGNKSYKAVDNVLFSRDMKNLIAYPAGLESQRYSIPTSVRSISAHAFAECRIGAVFLPQSVTSFNICCLASIYIGIIYVSTQSQYKTLDGNYSYVEPYRDYGDGDTYGTRVVLTEAKTGIVEGGEGEELVLGESMPVSCSYGEARFTLLKETSSVSAMSLSPKATSTPSYDGEVRVDFYPTGKNGIVNLKSLRYNFKNYKIVQVASNAFKSRKDVASVNLGEWVTAVGPSAFQGCKNLKTVSLGSGLRSVGGKAFMSCKSLKAVTLRSKSVKAIGGQAFKGMPAKAAFKVPKSKLKAYKKLFVKAGASKKATFKKA